MAKINLINQVFGKLTVIEESGRQNRKILWLCKCKCGNTKKITTSDLRSGNNKSCGCLKIEQVTELGKANKIHGHFVNNNPSATYRSWISMKTRCTNSNATGYNNYGGRGITICDRWINSFENFLQDMGERPRGTSLDRIDPNGNYEPSNCRWATAMEQNNNQQKHIKRH